MKYVAAIMGTTEILCSDFIAADSPAPFFGFFMVVRAQSGSRLRVKADESYTIPNSESEMN